MKVNKAVTKRENWDYENPERHAGGKTNRVVVSISFSRDDFEQAARSAELRGKRVSEFVRDAALGRDVVAAPIVSSGMMQGSFFFQGATGAGTASPYKARIDYVPLQ